MAGPARTCAVCREPDKQSVLIRFAILATDAARTVILDAGGESPGRGTYCHLRPDCLKHPKLSRMLGAALQKKAARPAKESGARTAALPMPLRSPDLKDLLSEARERSKAFAARERGKVSKVIDQIEDLLEPAKKERDANQRDAAVKPQSGKQSETKRRIRL